jgi:hypothetical protein
VLIAACVFAGSEDGSVVLWDVATLQVTRFFRHPCSHPISTVTILPRPSFLRTPAGPGGSREGSAGGSRTSKPTRLHPVAPFSKYAGPSPTLLPWQDGVVILDGSGGDGMPGGGLVESSGLLAACAATDSSPAGAAGAGWGGVRPSGMAASVEGGSVGTESVSELKLELEDAQAELKRWKRNYMELFELAQASTKAGST